MTLTELKKMYHEGLKNSYPVIEIDNIFTILAKHKLGFNRADITLNKKSILKPENEIYFKKSLKQLIKGIPVQYITGESEFYNLIFRVNPGVLIPRPETEELVDWVINDYKNIKDNLAILDIGTGSGCIAISLAANLKNSKVWALDNSTKALQTAKDNAIRNKVEIQLINADIFDTINLPDNLDIIISNPPYVRNSEKTNMHDNVLKNEPENALFVTDEKPLLYYHKIADIAIEKLRKKGVLYFEINRDFGKKVMQLLYNKGFVNVVLKKDFQKNNRMIKARL